MKFDQTEQNNLFISDSGEKNIAKICSDRNCAILECGIENLIVLKTTKSSFFGFLRDSFATLPEMAKRIFSTAIKASWRYKSLELASDALFSSIPRTILNLFAEHDSRSVQHTLYAMDETVLDAVGEIDEFAFSLPNIHYVPVDLKPFARKNDNRIFISKNEPQGLTVAQLSR